MKTSKIDLWIVASPAESPRAMTLTDAFEEMKVSMPVINWNACSRYNTPLTLKDKQRYLDETKRAIEEVDNLMAAWKKLTSDKKCEGSAHIQELVDIGDATLVFLRHLHVVLMGEMEFKQFKERTFSWDRWMLCGGILTLILILALKSLGVSFSNDQAYYFLGAGVAILSGIKIITSSWWK